jgi:NAD(P)H-nitrite reductase large subunit
MIYRKLVLKRGFLHGIVAAGPWKDSSKLHELVAKKPYIWPWQRTKFNQTGKL